ncbi:MAG: PGPGW domain-containing protein [Candidatus Adlerbacteria bacterium]|nr:PGPGW domain-containing protein [Candidatus Adlerbacteria bacterium]MDZ4226011.1 PGPGW domain-containing protein [Patescibacteria group bacterium]
MIKQTKRAIVFLLGVIFLIFGIIGLFLPFLQGILFIIIGLLLLSIFSPTLRDWIEHHTRKYPKVHEGVIKLQGFINRIVGEV